MHAVSIHAFRGEGDLRDALRALSLEVSIHAFRGEGDVLEIDLLPLSIRFNPRLPGGRRPPSILSSLSINSVSIHAFRGEGDKPVSSSATNVATFQSTPSGGKATGYNNGSIAQHNSFNPRLPGGRRQKLCCCAVRWLCVSIHAFRGEGDQALPTACTSGSCFNPRLPGGRRRVHGLQARHAQCVSIHAFRGEGDFRRLQCRVMW